MFMVNFPRIVGMHYFPALRELMLVKQDIEKIEGLESCLNLEKLWINENKIRKIEGLDSLYKLKELYIYKNQISKIEGLNSLGRLEVLWIFNNKIKKIEGLERLKNLRVLWIGQNPIERIGDSLIENQNLQELNIAGCNIGFFKEIQYLDRLRDLKSVSFKNPNFGQNPICSLCNYQTYALYHLTRITKLDELYITDEARRVAETTFLKKKMYYNMRIKTLKRNTTNVIKKASEFKYTRIHSINLNLNVLLRLQKELERELDEATYLFIPKDEKFLQDIELKLEVVNRNIEQQYSLIDITEKQFQSFCNKIYRISEQNICRLLVELETGGNIRLEEGKPGDVWYHSCADLIKSRFNLQDFKFYGVNGIKVTRVTRVHNRFLRNRFEEKLDTLVDTSDPSYKRSLEYLFYYAPDYGKVIEEGFLFENQEYTTLSNSVSMLEIPRIQHEPNKRTIPGRLLICKVFLGVFTHELSSKISKMDNSISRKNYPNYDSVYRTKIGDTKQRLWFIFDSDLILPEYLVEYEILREKQDWMVRDPFDVICKDLKPVSEMDAVDIRAFANVYTKFKQFCQQKPDQDVCSAVTNMTPVLRARKKIPEITEARILQVCNNMDFSSITYLNLFANGIHEIQCLSALENLKILELSFNEIEQIQGLENLTNLQILRLGFNLIKRIEGLDSLRSLLTLELNNNLLYRLDDINHLKRSVPHLQELNLKGNAVCSVNGYRHYVINGLPNLRIFDSQTVTEFERLQALQSTTVINDKLIFQNASFHHKKGNCLSQVVEQPDPSMLLDPSWFLKVVELNLSRQKIRKIQGLSKLLNLRSLNLSYNEISKIEGLDDLRKLQELNLESNRITKLEGLNKLHKLEKLELGKNKISKLENLEYLTHITLLSLEDNEIESLEGIEKLVNLMELYIGNNDINSLKHIAALKDIPKLIILDLSGNKLCECPGYRLYAIFHLKKLKVLDGIGIDQNESTKAKLEYTGKMTEEILVDKVGHGNFRNITELNLSNSGLKEISNLQNFNQLKHLNLENNQISNLNGLQGCTTLVSLNLAHNKIDTSHFKNNTFGKYLDGFIHLQKLILDANHIYSLIPLRLYKLPNLQILSLKQNFIMKLEGLEGLFELQRLYLDKNRLKFLDEKVLCQMTGLREFHANENSLRSLDGIQVLINLQVLSLSCNRIVELYELDKLSTLQQLIEANFCFNPVSRKSLYRPTLIYKLHNLRSIDGTEIDKEERERAYAFFSQDYYQQTEPRLIPPRTPVKFGSVNLELPMHFSNGVVPRSAREMDPHYLYKSRRSSSTSKLISTTDAQRRAQSANTQNGGTNYRRGFVRKSVPNMMRQPNYGFHSYFTIPTPSKGFLSRSNVFPKLR